MSDQTTEPPKTPSSNADDAVARFEARMAKDKAHEERNRPSRTKVETISEAMQLVEKQLGVNRKRLEQGGFRMAAQEQACREEQQELGWLIEDLMELRQELLAS